MTRHASMQVNHNQLKELQQVTQPRPRTRARANTHRLPRKRGTSTAPGAECAAFYLIGCV